MVLWRISRHASLSGDGGLRVSGRWHARGRRVLYCAESPAGALLEALVHFEIPIEDLPRRYRLLKIETTGDISIERVLPADLPGDWVDRVDVTRALGDAWLAARRSLLLAVPSVLVPETFNVLVNPAHPEARRLVLAGVSEHVVDPRLTRAPS